MWDTIKLFDAFQINWVDRSKNIMADFLVNIALKENDVTLNGILEVEIKVRPSIPNTLYNWQIFQDDANLLNFL